MDFTIKLMNTFENDSKMIHNRYRDTVNMFSSKSFTSLFTHLNIAGDRNSEMAYFMLDILFLLGDPRVSITLTDDTLEENHLRINETIPGLDRISTNAEFFNKLLNIY